MLKAIVLLLFAVFIFILHETGEITRFINPNYLSFSQVASVLFLFLFFIQVPRIFTARHNEHDHSQCGPWGCSHENDEGRVTAKTIIAYGIIILPLLTGFLLPYKDFGAAEALNRGVHYSSHDHSHIDGHGELNNPHEKLVMEMLKESVLKVDNENFGSYLGAITSSPANFKGKPIEIEGFILKDDLLANNLIVITRFLVTHCVADAHAVGLVIDKGATLGMEENTWICVRGELDVKESSDHLLIPVIRVNSWEEIQAPIEPYIYP
ncbi:TIGR03943 family protein [Alkalihalobacillus sp. MEB130]|uniref:TIGR03943 family putative permease subunit n=1 Tax=Alkalihalobacillus sp. MEB130 TaxID=2976704 RepID=UPI0028DEC93F|nr:TIGR03943 family protein [Alkalihalobacillus sp. MEB130]MDT8862190.1 TIGR03943 family protein [Alkalihalobacillus sp. MEB130]